MGLCGREQVCHCLSPPDTGNFGGLDKAAALPQGRTTLAAKQLTSTWCVRSTGQKQPGGRDVRSLFSTAFSQSLAVELRHQAGLLFTNADSLPTGLREGGVQESFFPKRPGCAWRTLKSQKHCSGLLETHWAFRPKVHHRIHPGVTSNREMIQCKSREMIRCKSEGKA